MALSVTPHGTALDALVAASRARHDSWIPVNAALRHQIEQGATTPAELASLLTEPRLDLTSSHADRVATIAGPGQADVNIVDITSASYPVALSTLDDAPLLLFVSGQLPHTSTASSLAIVGSRKPSPAGRDAAFRVAAHIARVGHPVISGLAEGIDTAAHNGALSVAGTTVAVVGTGIDRTFPAQNTALAARIATTGAVVSQFAPGQGPSKTTFPARNAIIAGLADASLLVELSERSGTRIEADRALEQGKPVWLWGPIMRTVPWAQQFTRHPQVDFVDTVDELLGRLRSIGSHAR